MEMRIILLSVPPSLNAPVCSYLSIRFDCAISNARFLPFTRTRKQKEIRSVRAKVEWK